MITGAPLLGHLDFHGTRQKEICETHEMTSEQPTEPTGQHETASPSSQPSGKSLAPSPPEQFLKLALGANHGDARLPAALLSVTLLMAVIAVWWRKRKQSPGDRSSRT